jgi:hypothetical protein
MARRLRDDSVRLRITSGCRLERADAGLAASSATVNPS